MISADHQLSHPILSFFCHHSFMSQAQNRERNFKKLQRLQSFFKLYETCTIEKPIKFFTYLSRKNETSLIANKRLYVPAPVRPSKKSDPSHPRSCDHSIFRLFSNTVIICRYHQKEILKNLIHKSNGGRVKLSSAFPNRVP